MKDSLSFLVQSLLQKNKIKIDGEELDFQIQSHPSYPSLHAITGVLSHFDIENTAIRVPVDKETLEQLPPSFIAQIKRNEVTDFALVVKKGKNYKTIYNNKENETISEAAFLEQFTGIIAAVEKDETKTTGQENTSNIQKPLVAISLALFTLLFFISNPSLSTSIYFILSLIGAGISFLIIQHDLGLSSKIVESICSQESKITNCNAVLNSKGATLYKNIKLSDVSLIYFIAISISCLLLNITNTSLNILYFISLSASPIVAYSIYYQLKISKNWCALCLGIASILVLQATVFFITGATITSLSFQSVLLIGFSFITITSIWLFISSKLKQQQELNTLKIESTKFKRNFELFNTLLQKQETINTPISETSEIIFGNKNAPLNITVITNPFCGHCKSVHSLVTSILKTHHNEINVTIRFNINTSNAESDGVLVSSRLLELFHTEGELKCLEAMHDIYNNADATSWLATWKKSDNADMYKNILEAEYTWCLDNNINFTPEILVNGKSFPQAYNRTDLAFFIENLNEFCATNEQATQLQKTL
ncbi:vitamin K epoxide reductase family protein [uncultured Lacinutrix sp.]|uniref:vitamin K epoxide reductase family protein n=1 Tax=uncultured Lacinutrix sp. TaxID=574032 RepID=UPI002614116C|nr:vitamin K epoxide reductase family protein [uncultured Lacinutrix sp.]